MTAILVEGSPDRTRVCVRVKVVPGASRSEVVGVHGDRLRVRIAAPPEAGKTIAIDGLSAIQAEARIHRA